MFRSFGKLPSGPERAAILRSPNFNGRQFENPVPTRLEFNPFRVLKEYIQSDSALRRPSRTIPVTHLKSSDFGPPSRDLEVTWLGHASVLIETGGIRIIADGVFADRVSPIPFMGPKRHHPMPVELADLPEIDIVLISHNHYDHLDMGFIDAVKETDAHFITPLAVGATLEYWGVPRGRIHELDWHGFLEWKGVRITATPARHFTNRGLLDRNKSFWASFVIDNGRQRAFFCGDSGFYPGFSEIGRQYGPMDITMIGIGAYNADWQAIHTNPEEAAEAHALLNGMFLLPIHWCTFDLALHAWSEPVERLITEAEKRDIRLLLPHPGETVDASGNFNWQHWWRA